MCGAGTWTTTAEHEQLIRTTQLRMFRLIIQTKSKCKRKKQKRLNSQDDEMSEATNEKRKEDSTNDESDQDSSISCENDTESTSSLEEELEDGWNTYTEAQEKLMRTC